ncbi:integral membrane transporter [Thermobifida fusca TM51]|uniref:Integral membrane transporter n=1 Tax=Thermobifida fusca TM51 TaxID=1169414 RepID=A0A9P2TBA1_THEFU|nr:MFS transporter [Thermobifida fusca]EOR71543.1 integral membrane transporter [Thermobifida fusca TM51]
MAPHPTPTRRARWHLAAGIVLAALNLRTAITSIGPLLTEITTDLHLTPVTTGLLTTLPVLCFAGFGALTPALQRRWGDHHVLLAALAALTLGLASRALVTDPWLFLALSTLALAGGAVGNVLLPTLVKQHFPHRVGLLTAAYTTAMALGTTLAAAATVPLATAFHGNWRPALASYALLGLVATIPWALALRNEPRRHPGDQPISIRTVLTTALGWQSTLFFATQSAIAYIMFGWFAHFLRDHGMPAPHAGLVLSYLTALAIPTSLAVPAVVVRMRNPVLLIALFVTCYLVGFAGLLTAPVTGAWLWATLIGIGMSSFPLALTFFGLRARSPHGTAALSAATQGVGYLLAGTGPFLFGLLRDLSGDWRLSIGLLVALTFAHGGCGILLSRPRHIEDAVVPSPVAP